MKTIRWGMIGCGAVTEMKSAPAYQQTEGFELVGVFNRTRARAEDYAARHGVPQIFDSAEALITAPHIDAVYIATPPDSHEAYALAVAAVGKPCCIEKPIAPDHAGAQRICDTFTHAKVPLFVAYYRRSLPRFRAIKALLDDGAIGAVRHVHWTLTKSPNAADLSQTYNWRTDILIAPGGYFDDLASHGLDLLCWLFGPVISASGYATNQQGLYSAADAVTGSWLYASGVIGSGNWNFGSDARQDRVEIIGSEGRICFSIFDEMPITLKRGDTVIEDVIPNPPHIQQYHVEAMRDALDERVVHPSTGTSATHTAWLMGALLGRV